MVNPLSPFFNRAEYNGNGRPITVPPECSTINDGQSTRLLGGIESKSSRARDQVSQSFTDRFIIVKLSIQFLALDNLASLRSRNWSTTTLWRESSATPATAVSTAPCVLDDYLVDATAKYCRSVRQQSSTRLRPIIPATIYTSATIPESNANDELPATAGYGLRPSTTAGTGRSSDWSIRLSTRWKSDLYTI